MRRFVFVSTYTHPSRDSIEAMMRRSFPEFALDHVWVRKLAKSRKAMLLKNVWFVIAEYGWQLIRQPSKLRHRFFQTVHLAECVHRLASEVIRPGEHAFSFQTRSMFDTSVPGVPHFIYTDHTHLSNLSTPGFDRQQLRSQDWIEMERNIYRNAKIVFTRSSDVKSDLINHYGISPGKVVCAYSGSNVKVPADELLDDQRYRARHILFVGSAWQRKGGPTLVEAFRRILRSYPDARLTIAGSAPHLDLPNCTILGRVSLEELSKLFASASVFCLPTRLEPFGIAFIEAMMHKLPIVATNVGAVPDMVKQGVTGLLVSPDNVEELETALLRLLADPDLCKRYGAAGHQHAQLMYNWENVGNIIRSHILANI